MPNWHNGVYARARAVLYGIVKKSREYIGFEIDFQMSGKYSVFQIQIFHTGVTIVWFFLRKNDGSHPPGIYDGKSENIRGLNFFHNICLEANHQRNFARREIDHTGTNLFKFSKSVIFFFHQFCSIFKHLCGGMWPQTAGISFCFESVSWEKKEKINKWIGLITPARRGCGTRNMNPWVETHGDGTQFVVVNRWLGDVITRENERKKWEEN